MRQAVKTSRWALATALCLGVCGALPRPVSAQEGTPAVVEGRLNAANPATGAVTVGATALTTSNATVVLLNSAPVSVSDLAVGEHARAEHNRETGLASRIEVERPEGWLWGRVTAYSVATGSANATLTLQRRDGASEVLVVGPTSMIPLEDGSDLDSLVGSNSRVVFDPVTKVIFRLQPFAAEPAEPDSAPYPPPAPTPDPVPVTVPLPTPVRYRAGGVVTAVDAAGGTLTLVARCIRAPGAKTVGEGKGSPVSLVLSVGAGTELLLEGKPCGLDRLAAGDRVRCLYEVAGDQTRALKIVAFLPPVRVAAGLVRAVGDGTVAIGPAARPRILVVTGETYVSVDGMPGTAASILLGQRGCALYRERGGTATALAVVTMTPPVRPARKQNARR